MGEAGSNGRITGDFMKSEQEATDLLNEVGVVNPKEGDALIFYGYLFYFNGKEWESCGKI